QTLLLIRVEDMRGFSHLTAARSADGFTNWQIDPAPTMEADQNSREEKWGLEDPRIVWLEEQKQFAITYTSFSEGGPVVSLAITKNFRTFARLGGLLPPEDKDACLFPRRFRGRFALIHRPIVRGEAHIWISFSPDLKHWGDHRALIKARHAYWDCHRVGLACQPIETEYGWLLFYHGVRMTTAGAIYRMGLALLDLEEPWKVLRRSDEWILGPRASYERIGDVGGVVFPSGAVIDEKSNNLHLYYGAADCTVAVATAKLSDLTDYIMSCPES
ncbi:MAG: glycosidase, partial [Planctomycetes bacterium]|nr:glycosidase [Planctomycetota bacterium]